MRVWSGTEGRKIETLPTLLTAGGRSSVHRLLLEGRTGKSVKALAGPGSEDQERGPLGYKLPRGGACA